MSTTEVRGMSAFRVFLEMIKFEHSIFALPFAMIGMMWGSDSIGLAGWPGPRVFAWILVAMVSCRSAAMSYNRIADRNIDALNPRTKMRAIPAGILQLKQANLYFFASIGLFFLASAMLNPLCLYLSPVALFVVLVYSQCKRFTPLCHFVLGLGLGIAPAAAWIGSTGKLHPAILPMVAAVLFWTGGFDIIYSLQDEEFDREHHLRSLPETVGKARALVISRISHVLAVCCLAAGGMLVGAGVVYFVGVAFAAALLAYEQNLVKPDDLSKVNLAFFTLNGFVSIGVFVFALLDRFIR